jgi:hypothetical protein
LQHSLRPYGGGCLYRIAHSGSATRNQDSDREGAGLYGRLRAEFGQRLLLFFNFEIVRRACGLWPELVAVGSACDHLSFLVHFRPKVLGRLPELISL